MTQRHRVNPRASHVELESNFLIHKRDQVGLIVFGVRLFYSTVGLAMFPVPGARLPYVAVSATFDLLGGTILSLASCRRTLQPSA